jgi:hypothetical protein
MANKYLIHGATYCGNGTASNEAASAGASGAWNDINVFEGTAPAYGSLNAGDTVYIRSKTSAGADITRTLAAGTTLGASVATTSAWVTWVIDGGAIWSGIDGTLKYDCPSTYTITLRGFNYYRAQNADKFVIRETNTNADYKKIVALAFAMQVDNLFVDCSLNAHATGNWMQTSGGGGQDDELVLRNLHLKWAKHYAALLTFRQWSKVTLINPLIELTVSDGNGAVIELGDYGSCVTAIGGRIFGAGATTGNYVVKQNTSGRSGRALFIGTQIPKTMPLLANAPVAGPWKFEGIGLDAEEGGAICESWGSADSRSDGYYPTLNAFLPDSVSTPWSWKVYPSSAGLNYQFNIPVAKEYTAAAATKTITCNALLADSITSANKGTMWLEVSYIDDSTGLPASVSSRDFTLGALDSSTAAWSATTYGSINLVEKQLSVTTPTSIKQDTMVIVTLCGIWKSASALDLMFVCPDVSLS